jgi:hypothetical protein
MFVLLWFGCEILGAIFGVILTKGEVSAGAYLFALLGAAVGAGISFVIVASLPAVEDEEGAYRGRKRRRIERDDDEYDASENRRSRRGERDESYREKFSAGRARRDDDEDSEEPETRYRRRRRDDED